METIEEEPQDQAHSPGDCRYAAYPATEEKAVTTRPGVDRSMDPLTSQRTFPLRRMEGTWERETVPLLSLPPSAVSRDHGPIRRASNEDVAMEIDLTEGDSTNKRPREDDYVSDASTHSES